jgi:hypothetical protein
MESSNQIEKAQPDRGSFDNSFGVAGRVYLYDPVAGVRIQPRAMCVLDDGRMIIASCSYVTQFTYLTLLNDRGEVVSEFGDSGTVRFKLSSLLPERLLAQPCKVFFDEITEKFIMGFYTSELGYSQKVGLAQFDVNGELDGNYGIGGAMIWSSQATDDDPAKSVSTEIVEDEQAPLHHGAMVLLKDGGVMILATLYHQNRGFTHLVKVGANGVLDQTFVGTGYKLINRNNRVIHGEDLILQDDAYLVIATTQLTGEGGWFVAKFKEDGSLDTDFSVGGYYDENPGVKKSVLYREDQSKMYVVGTSANAASQHIFLSTQRREADGTEDPHYGENGWAGALSNGWTDDTVVCKAALYSPESTVVMAGVEYRATVEESQIFIAKVEQDMGWFGQFGNNGKVFLLGETVLHDLAIQRDGKIIFISGYNGEPNSNSIGRLIG